MMRRLRAIVLASARAVDQTNLVATQIRLRWCRRCRRRGDLRFAWTRCPMPQRHSRRSRDQKSLAGNRLHEHRVGKSLLMTTPWRCLWLPSASGLRCRFHDLLFSARITEPASPSEVQPSTVLSDNAAAFAHAESIIEDLRKIGGFNDDLTIDVKNDLDERVLSMPFLPACAWIVTRCSLRSVDSVAAQGAGSRPSHEQWSPFPYSAVSLICIGP